MNLKYKKAHSNQKGKPYERLEHSNLLFFQTLLNEGIKLRTLLQLTHRNLISYTLAYELEEIGLTLLKPLLATDQWYRFRWKRATKKKAEKGTD
jgi:hypothetical protein